LLAIGHEGNPSDLLEYSRGTRADRLDRTMRQENRLKLLDPHGRVIVVPSPDAVRENVPAVLDV